MRRSFEPWRPGKDPLQFTDETMSIELIAATIEDFVRVSTGVSDRDLFFSRSVNVFEMGYIDSAALVELTEWLEQRFGVVLSMDDLLDRRFATIDGIASIIVAKRNHIAP